MGCCHSNEDEKNSASSIIKLNHIKSSSIASKASTMSQSENFELMTKQQINTKRYLELLEHLEDFSEEKKIQSYPRWASPPTTKASATLAILNRNLKHNKIKFSFEMLKDKLGCIINHLKSEMKSLKQHSIFFLYEITKNCESDLIELFLEEEVFFALNPLLICNGFEERYYAARVCEAIYEGNIDAKMEFVEASGVELLFEEIYMGNYSSIVFRDLINCVICLIMDDNTPIEKYVEKVNNVIDRNIDMRVKNKVVFVEARETFDLLMKILLGEIEEEEKILKILFLIVLVVNL